MRVDFSPEALRDLDAIFDYIARDNPSAALRWVNRLITRAEKAAKQPLAGRIVPELADQAIREVFVRHYRIVYRVERGRLLVLTVIEGHRRLPHGPA
ncbi:MAG: type II toxin-antitoxin system RelE/ParE family toxin [Deltaproteobacteria bacterium]|nr:type II toxin-antitoxin system RelE/ParE family toxin [Deltaproteobacteria bacterium]